MGFTPENMAKTYFGVAVALMLCCGAMNAAIHQDVANLQGSSGCADGEYDAGSVEVAGEEDSGPNCKACSDLAPTLFGGKGRPKGNGNCERECGECERPTPHPVHNVCRGTAVVDGVATWFCRQIGMRFHKGENGDCEAPGR